MSKIQLTLGIHSDGRPQLMFSCNNQNAINISKNGLKFANSNIDGVKNRFEYGVTKAKDVTKLNLFVHTTHLLPHITWNSDKFDKLPLIGKEQPPQQEKGKEGEEKKKIKDENLRSRNPGSTSTSSASTRPTSNTHIPNPYYHPHRRRSRSPSRSPPPSRIRSRTPDSYSSSYSNPYYTPYRHRTPPPPRSISDSYYPRPPPPAVPSPPPAQAAYAVKPKQVRFVRGGSDAIRPRVVSYERRSGGAADSYRPQPEARSRVVSYERRSGAGTISPPTEPREPRVRPRVVSYERRSDGYGYKGGERNFSDGNSRKRDEYHEGYRGGGRDEYRPSFEKDGERRPLKRYRRQYRDNEDPFEGGGDAGDGGGDGGDGGDDGGD